MEDISKLIDIMRRLRDPQTGCAWDRRQTFRSIAPYTIEEAYEVADAIERDAMDELRDELGDLLLQVVFHAQMAEERDLFAFPDVINAICEKMIRRHPHVFSDDATADEDTLRERWEASKRAERRARQSQASDGAPGLLDDVPVALPGLTRAWKLSARAATVGFEWTDESAVRAKVAEELAELDELLAEGERGARLEDEFGDVFFALVNLCRHTGVDPEACLRRTNEKFLRRFAHVEACVDGAGQRWEDTDLDALEAHWQAAKAKGL